MQVSNWLITLGQETQKTMKMTAQQIMIFNQID